MKKLLFFLIASFVLFSCVKQEFDDPPADTNTAGLVANKTIKELKSIHKPGEFETIQEDWIIEGVVVADDASGNYFKTLVIQDATSGIDLKLDATGLYNDYPIGRKIFIKCKGLVISDYNGLIQIGGGTFINNSGQEQLAGIEQLLIPTFVFKGPTKQEITPRELKIAELSNEMVSTLITLKDVQFRDADIDQTFADAAKKQSLNRSLEDCDGISIVLRSSGYASFANDKTPANKGTVTGIYSVFGSTKQFIIRDVNDLKMNDTRCNGGGGGGGIGDEVAIGTIISSFKNGQTTAPANSKIVGTVISDREGKNINALNLVLQGADNKGIIVRFSGSHSFALGDVLEISVSNAVISTFQGALQIAGGATSNAKKTGTNTVTPRKVTLQEFTDNFESLESTLVQVENATASTTSKFGGSIKLSDASGGSATLFTYNTTSIVATFANEPLPSDVINVVGIASKFNNTLQIQMRNLKDATKGSGGSTGGTAVLKSIAEIRNLYKGALTNVPANTYIQGIVISDRKTTNISPLNMVIQEPNGRGIVVRFDGAHNFELGDEVKVTISNQELSEFQSLLQLNRVPLSNATKVGTGTITPAEKTIDEIINNFESLESSLVVIKNANIPPSTKYGGTIKISDGTGIIDLFTAFSGSTIATFANNKPPVGIYSITAIVNQYKTSSTTTSGHQIQIRNESDIK
jgi:hypothetical protein